MSHTIVGKLTKAATQFQAGEREAEKRRQIQAPIEQAACCATCIERQVALEARQKAEREADLNHQARINREALSSLIEIGIAYR